MLATFVIGLREGLEASLIVGIIAAFLKQSGRTDAIRRMWFGVGLAIVLCFGVGLVLRSVDKALPQRQQEMLESVIAVIAVVMVSYMVLWMRAHSRNLKSDLQAATSGALASGSTRALVLMAFLAVFREGFETAVFLLAAFQNSVSPANSVIGAALGILIAVGIGFGIYKGGVRLNLSKFFRATGVVLVLVAAGLVISALRAANEAGWLTVGQQTAVRLPIAASGSVSESLLTGVLGIRSTTAVVELVAYLLFLIPMLLVVLWPPKRAMTRRTLQRVLTGSAVASLIIAGTLAATSTARAADRPTQLAVVGAVSSGTSLTSGDALDGSKTTGTITESGELFTLTSGNVTTTGIAAREVSGHAVVSGRAALEYSGADINAAVGSSSADGLPATLTLAQVESLSAGRLPVGLQAADFGGKPAKASYSDTVTPQTLIDPTTSVVLGVQFELVRTAAITLPSGAVVAVGAVADTVFTLSPAAATVQSGRVNSVIAAANRHEVAGQVIPGLLVVFSAVLLVFALPRRRRGRVGAQPAGGTAAPAVAAGSPGIVPPVREQGSLAHAGPLRT